MSKTRRQVLAMYKQLLRTRNEVFKGDEYALKETRSAIREAFDKNRQLDDHEQIVNLLEMAASANEILRKDVMQARFVSEDTIRVNVRLDNVARQGKQPMFKFLEDD